MFDILVLILALVLFTVLAFKRVGAMPLAGIVALVTCILARLPILDTMLGPFMETAAGYVKNYCFVFFLGAAASASLYFPILHVFEVTRLSFICQNDTFSAAKQAKNNYVKKKQNKWRSRAGKKEQSKAKKRIRIDTVLSAPCHIFTVLIDFIKSS